MNSRRTVALFRWLVSMCALAGIVLVFQRWLHVNPTTVALTLLLFILVLAAEFGLRYAVVISVVATACYNFFFLPPLGTFTVSDPQNWLALLAFLATSIIASRLSERARDEAREARHRQRELEVLFRLSRELLRTENVSALLNSVPATVASVVTARGCALYLLEGNKLFQAGSDLATEIELPHFQKLSTELARVTCEADEILIPLRAGVKPRGLLQLRGALLSTETAEAIGGLISVSIDRAQALEMVARNEAAKESERLRNLMIDSITHELRTPLTSIKGAATTLLSSDMGPEDSRELLTVIDEESDRLNRLVAEALEMAQLDAQQVHMNIEPLGVNDLIVHALSTCAWVEDEHPVDVRVPDGLRAMGDRDFLQKVLCNLMENAAKYSKPGTPIVVSAEPREGVVLVSVADSGIGIDPSEQGLIFERFYRSRGSSEGTSGTGMGLAISRAIVEAHGGSLDVVSQLDQGSVFTFSLQAVA